MHRVRLVLDRGFTFRTDGTGAINRQDSCQRRRIPAKGAEGIFDESKTLK
jgi:hypothetical protein